MISLNQHKSARNLNIDTRNSFLNNKDQRDQKCNYNFEYYIIAEGAIWNKSHNNFFLLLIAMAKNGSKSKYLIQGIQQNIHIKTI